MTPQSADGRSCDATRRPGDPHRRGRGGEKIEVEEIREVRVFGARRMVCVGSEERAVSE